MNGKTQVIHPYPTIVSISEVLSGIETSNVKCSKSGNLVTLSGYFIATSDVVLTKDQTKLFKIPYKPLYDIVGLSVCDGSWQVKGIQFMAIFRPDGYFYMNQPSSKTLPSNSYYTIPSFSYYTND